MDTDLEFSCSIQNLSEDHVEYCVQHMIICVTISDKLFDIVYIQYMLKCLVAVIYIYMCIG